MARFEIDAFPWVSHTERETRQAPLLIDVLKATTFVSPNRAIQDDITEVALGAFKMEADELMQRTVATPWTKKGRAAFAFPPDGHIRIHTQDVFPGRFPTIHLFQPNNELRQRMPKILRQDKFLVTILRTDLLPNAPAPLDITPLLTEDSDPYALTAAFTINPQESVLVFRGQNTPALETTEARERMEILDDAVENRARHATKFGMSQEKLLSIRRRASYAMLRDVARHYDLRVFISQQNHVAAHLYTPDQLDPRTWNR